MVLAAVAVTDGVVPLLGWDAVEFWTLAYTLASVRIDYEAIGADWDLAADTATDAAVPLFGRNAAS